jgi:hypothetical protein
MGEYMQGQRRVEWTCDLGKGLYMKWLEDQGYLWVSPHVRPWLSTLRSPTVGRMVELTTFEDVGSVNVRSVAGRKLLKGLC